MSNRLASLLASWFPEKDSCQWALANIIETQRSSYHKSGAMMLINSLGIQHPSKNSVNKLNKINVQLFLVDSLKRESTKNLTTPLIK